MIEDLLLIHQKAGNLTLKGPLSVRYTAFVGNILCFRDAQRHLSLSTWYIGLMGGTVNVDVNRSASSSMSPG